MWWIPALISGALSIAGRLTGRARRAEAADRAIERGAEALAEGQTLSRQNAEQLAQDNVMILSLSGVSASEGTAQQLQRQTQIQSDASVNKMANDFESWKESVLDADNADAINTAFSVAGDIFSTAGSLYYDSVRVSTPAVAKIDTSYTGPSQYQFQLPSNAGVKKPTKTGNMNNLGVVRV